MFWSDISAWILSVVTMKWLNQSNLEHNEWTVCWCNQSQLRYSIIQVPKNMLTSKVLCNWSLENLRVVWSSQVILVSSHVTVYFAKYYSRLLFWLCYGFSDMCIEFKLCKRVKVSYKSSNFVSFNQNKPYPRLCVKSPTCRVTNIMFNTNTRKRGSE